MPSLTSVLLAAASLAVTQALNVPRAVAPTNNGCNQDNCWRALSARYSAAATDCATYGQVTVTPSTSTAYSTVYATGTESSTVTSYVTETLTQTNVATDYLTGTNTEYSTATSQETNTQTNTEYSTRTDTATVATITSTVKPLYKRAVTTSSAQLASMALPGYVQQYCNGNAIAPAVRFASVCSCFNIAKPTTVTASTPVTTVIVTASATVTVTSNAQQLGTTISTIVVTTTLPTTVATTLPATITETGSTTVVTTLPASTTLTTTASATATCLPGFNLKGADGKYLSVADSGSDKIVQFVDAAPSTPVFKLDSDNSLKTGDNADLIANVNSGRGASPLYFSPKTDIDAHHYAGVTCARDDDTKAVTCSSGEDGKSNFISVSGFPAADAAIYLASSAVRQQTLSFVYERICSPVAVVAAEK